MKPKEIKRPFTWNEREILIHEGIWYVPDQLDNYDTFKFPGWGSVELFGNDRPIKIEYCSGNGQWIHKKALEEPQNNWVAVELKFDRVRKIRSKVIKSNLKNLMIVCGEGYITTKTYFPSNSVSEIFINFADPWPKRRHWKNRIIQDHFVDEIQRVLVPEGVITFVTDDDGYSQWAIDVLLRNHGLKSVYEQPYYTSCIDGYGDSFFKDLWVNQGKTIKYHKFQKVI